MALRHELQRKKGVVPKHRFVIIHAESLALQAFVLRTFAKLATAFLESWHKNALASKHFYLCYTVSEIYDAKYTK